MVIQSQEVAERAMRSRYFRNFVIIETIFNEEVGMLGVFSGSIDEEIEGIVYVHFEGDQAIVRRVSGEAGTILPLND